MIWVHDMKNFNIKNFNFDVVVEPIQNANPLDMNLLKFVDPIREPKNELQYEPT